MSRIPAAVLAALALVVLEAQTPDRLIIVNARVADVATGRARPVAAVVIEGQRIAALHTTMPASLPEPARRVDAAGATLVPALTDVAVQAVPGAALDVDFYYAASLAHGVMRMRSVDVRLPWAVEQRARLTKGEVLGPRLWTSGPAIDMRSAFGSRSRPVLSSGLLPFVQVPDAAGAAREVARQAASGVDWVRLRESVPVEVVRAAIVEARKGKVRVSLAAGATSMAQAAQAGVTLVDGLGAPFKPLGETGTASQTPPGSPIGSPTPPGGDVPTSADGMWARSSASEQRALAAQLTRAKVAVAPMLALEAWRSGERQNLRESLDLLPKTLRTALEAEPTPAATDPLRRSFERRRAFVAALAAAGGSLIAATGSTANGWPVPGRTIQTELALLVESGVSPADALRAATTGGAELLGDRKGAQIMSGAQADFFVVDGDPLTDITSLSRITMIVRAGEILDRGALLARAKKAAGGSR
jgi:hypothetical protein